MVTRGEEQQDAGTGVEKLGPEGIGINIRAGPSLLCEDRGQLRTASFSQLKTHKFR